MSAASTTSVLIVGAGPTGLALACELARLRVPVRIVEASPGPQPGSRGKGVQPRTLEVLDDLGIVDRVLANGRMAMPIRVTGPDGVTRDNDAVAFRDRPDIPYQASLITPQWRMEEALRERAAELGVEVGFGTALRGFEQTASGVTAVLDRDGAEETVAADWMVGADGGHSSIRKGLGIAFDGTTLDTVRMIVADVAVDGLDRDAWHMWRHADGMVMLCPLPSTDAFQFQASIAPGQDGELSVGNLQAILEARSGRHDIRVSDPSWWSLWRANIRLVDRYRVGRVLIGGDAAHIHSPAGGQGMNTGIQDAHNLGWKLAAVVAGADPALLDTYEEERRPVAERVLALSNERLRQTLEDNGMPIRGDANTMQLTIGYRGSSLSADGRAGDAAVRAGDRVPDVPGLLTAEGPRRLFDLIRGGRFTVLSFGAAPLDGIPSSARIVRVVTGSTGRAEVTDSEVTDPEGTLAAAFEVRPGAIVVLRPDGYIGAIADDGDARTVAEYVSRFAPLDAIAGSRP